MSCIKKCYLGGIYTTFIYFHVIVEITRGDTGMSMVLSKWILTPIKVGCKSRK